MDLQPWPRRSAQGGGVLVVATGGLVWLAGLAPLPLIIVEPPSRSRDLRDLAIAGLGLAIALGAGSLLRWGEP